MPKLVLRMTTYVVDWNQKYIVKKDQGFRPRKCKNSLKPDRSMNLAKLDITALGNQKLREGKKIAKINEKDLEWDGCGLQHCKQSVQKECVV